MAAKYRNRRAGARTRFPGIWVLLFTVLYLLLPGFNGFGGISAFKTHLYYGLTGLLGIGMLIALLRQRSRGGLRRDRLPRLSGLGIAALCYLFFTLLSAALSPYQPDAWYSEKCHEAAVTIVCYLLMFGILAGTESWNETAKVVLLWALSAFCLISVIQLLGGNPFGLYPNGMTYADGYGRKYSGAFLGTMGNVDLVSVFLCTVIPLTIVMAWRDRRLRWWAAGVGVACLAVLLWIRVLCGIVGLLMGLVLSAVVVVPWRKNHRRIYVGLLAAAAVCGVLLLRFWDPPVNFLHELHEILNGRISDRFGTGRVFIWRQLLERIPDRLFFGTGPDTVRLTGLAPFQRFDASGKLVSQAMLTDAHCFPLQILYCQGLPALLSWLVMVGFAVRTWWQTRTDPVCAALGASLVCWICAMLFGFCSVILQPWFWLLLGLLVSRARSLRGETSGSK